MRPRRPTALVPVAALALAVLALGGCGGGEGASPPTTAPGITLPGSLVAPSGGDTTTTAPPGSTGPQADDPATGGPTTSALAVTDFVVQAPITCSGANYTATLTWQATGARAATVLVDGAQVAAPVPVTGPFDVVLACDGGAHAVVLVLADGAGGTAIRTQAVTSTPEG